MHGIGLEFPLQDWFDFKTPRTSVPKNYIAAALQEEWENLSTKPSAKMVWLGSAPTFSTFSKSKKGKQWEMATLTFQDKRETVSIQVDLAQGEWLLSILQRLGLDQEELLTYQEVKNNYENAGLEDFELFWYGKALRTLNGIGLLSL
jgi:hypothetical protein